MSALFEMFPFAFGVLLGLTWPHIGGLQRRHVAWALSCIGLGASATFASGEWRASFLYFPFDVSLVALVSVAVALGMAYLQKRSEEVSGRNGTYFRLCGWPNRRAFSRARRRG